MYPVQEQGPFDIESVSLIINENNVINNYELHESIDKYQFMTEIQNYASHEKILENTVIDIDVQISYTIIFKTYCGTINQYEFFHGYLKDENMNYLYQVDNYEHVEELIKNNFI